MFGVVLLYFVFITFKSEATDIDSDIQVIHVSYTEANNDMFTVLKDEPLKILLDDDYASVVLMCNNYYWQNDSNNVFIPTTLLNKTVKRNFIYIANVTDDMSTRWKCTILQEYHGPPRYPYNGRNYTAKDLLFNIHVKGARKVELKTNNVTLTPDKVDLSDGYDAKAHYTYDSGEDIDLTCTRLHFMDTLRLEYYNAEGGLLFKTNHSQKTLPKLKFRSVLTSENDNFYVDCVCITQKPTREYRNRVFFYLRNNFVQDTNAVLHPVTFYVNGEQQLLVNQELDPSYDDYQTYKYIDGEQLNVICEKNKTLRGSLQSFSTGETITGAKYFENRSKIWITLNTFQQNVHKKTLVCFINNTDIQKANARMTFISDIPERAVRILGLPRKNIMYQYSNADKWTIEYQFTVNENLNLTCVSKGTPSLNNKQFRWKSEDEDLVSEVISKPTSVFTSTSFVKVLNRTLNQSKIECIYSENDVKSTVEVILHLKPELISEKPITDIDDDGKMELIIITVGGGICIIAIAIMCFMIWRKRTKHSRLIENEDLQNQNDSPIPAFPSQWENKDEGVTQENYNYDSINNTFNKRQSNTPSENHYTEIDDNFKPKNDGIGAAWNSTIPPGQSVNIPKETDDFNHSNNYQNFGNPFQETYKNIQHDLPLNNKGRKCEIDVYSNVSKIGKNKRVTFQENEPQPAKRAHSDVNFFLNSTNIDDFKSKHNSEVNYANTNQIALPGNEHLRNNYENYAIENKAIDNLVYAEPYSELGGMIRNNLYR